MHKYSYCFLLGLGLSIIAYRKEVSIMDNAAASLSLKPTGRLNRKWNAWSMNFKKHWPLLVLISLTLIYVFIFCYIPMYGVLVAFQEGYMPGDPVIGETTIWNGFENFKLFFSNEMFAQIFLNTFLLCFFGFLVGFPLPIIIALLLNALPSKKSKKAFQTIFYAPHFISLVVLVAMLQIFFGSSGLFPNIDKALGGAGESLFLDKDAFRPLFIFSGNWQDFGWSAIIYIAALAGIDPSLHEAAVIDGASRWQRVWHVDFPAIFPTVSTMLILSLGNLMSCGYEKVLLMQTSGNLDTSEIISTYVYNISLGPTGGLYSESTAINLFNSVINIVLLVSANYLSKKFSEYSMW